MVKHQPLQYYEPQLCLSCLTGIYGCRWKRYQRSHDDTTKWERLWFVILTFTFFLTLVWFYFWWEVHNDYNEINWYFYNRMGYWSDWSIPILVMAAAGFTYITTLLILALCHIAVGQQMNLHWLHKVGLMVTLMATVVTVSSIAQLWDDEWEMVVISIQATAPFLHIGALAVVTALSWLIAGQFARMEKATSQMLMFTTYFAVLVALYLIPLTVSSPCIMEKKDLGPKPAIIGHRGAPMLAPENTLMSFQKAVEQKTYGVQADVTISYDGVPFLMHDRTLRRTTNVKKVFPERAKEHSSMFNWTDLERLNAGEWFLKKAHKYYFTSVKSFLYPGIIQKYRREVFILNQILPESDRDEGSPYKPNDVGNILPEHFIIQRNDPFWTAGSLSDSDYLEAANQSVCKLADMLQIAKDNTSVILNFQDLPQDHPYYSTYINITLQTILESGIQQQAVMWLPNMERQLVRQIAPGFRQTSDIKVDVARLRDKGIKLLNLRYTKVTREDIREYTAANLSINLYVVNEPWLYSILWCAGVQSVTSDSSQILSKVPFPVWLLLYLGAVLGAANPGTKKPPEEYNLIWITADLISFAIIVGVFIFQKWRLGSIRTYNPEQIMLSAAVRRSSRDVKIMKEKLIFSEINSGVENADDLSLYSENGYSNEAITPMGRRDMKLRVD